ncbi:MAG TPA: DUF996 domain-containing protein [candidate division Zixibacteria bacterium]|nr:DUF996 domain-containing protein [candidate division Zixibacteria bacterium]
MSLDSDRTLGGVGALLIAVGSFFPFLSLVGIILVLVSMRGLAGYYKEDSLFKNALYGFIFGIIGIVAAIVLFVVFFFSYMITNTGSNGTIPVAVFPTVSGVGLLILILVVVLVFSVLEAVFFMRAFNVLADKSGEKMFRTAGLLLFLGAILTIVLVGFVLLFVGWILAAVAFFSIKRPTAPKERPPLPPPFF